MLPTIPVKLDFPGPRKLQRLGLFFLSDSRLLKSLVCFTVPTPVQCSVGASSKIPKAGFHPSIRAVQSWGATQERAAPKLGSKARNQAASSDATGKSWGVTGSSSACLLELLDKPVSWIPQDWFIPWKAMGPGQVPLIQRSLQCYSSNPKTLGKLRRPGPSSHPAFGMCFLQRSMTAVFPSWPPAQKPGLYSFSYGGDKCVTPLYISSHYSWT